MGINIHSKQNIRVDYDLITRYISKSIGQDAIYVELGAATGASAKKFCDFALLKPENCFLIEACPENVNVLRENLPGYQIFNYAISNKNGELPFYIYDDPNEPGSSRSNSINKIALQRKLRKGVVKKIVVPAITLKSFFKENSILYCDYLFMNVEGAEYDIFNGDCSFLQKLHFFYLDLHSGLYGDAKNARDIIDIKLRIYDFICQNNFRRIGGFLRGDIMDYQGHLTFLWENENWHSSY